MQWGRLDLTVPYLHVGATTETLQKPQMWRRRARPAGKIQEKVERVLLVCESHGSIQLVLLETQSIQEHRTL